MSRERIELDGAFGLFVEGMRQAYSPMIAAMEQTRRVEETKARRAAEAASKAKVAACGCAV